MSPETRKHFEESGLVTFDANGTMRLTAETFRSMVKAPFLHFVGFKDDRVHNALRVFGRPDFWHRHWDMRASEDIAPGDVVVFADGDEHSPTKPFAYDDSAHF